MSPPRRLARAIPWALTALLSLTAAEAKPPRPAPEKIEAPDEVVHLVNDVAEALGREDAPNALKRVDQWEGDPHPLVDLARGHALMGLERHEHALAAYQAALKTAPTLRPAALGLMNAQARLERYGDLRKSLAEWTNPAEAEVDILRLWLTVAQRTEDLPLTELISRQGALRFPDEEGFRLALARALLDTGRPREAIPLLTRLLDHHPREATWWQALAYAYQLADDPEAARPCLEAAVLAAPKDEDLRARFVAAALAAGFKESALAYAAPLARSAQPDRVLLAAQAALQAEDLAQAKRWLAPVIERDTDLSPRQREASRRLAARIALGLGDRDAARAHLSALLDGDRVDPQVLLQLAALERAAGALSRAEALLRQGAALDGPGARQATLHLAHLLLQRGRRDEAAACLRRHLVDVPDDEAARQLLSLAEG